MKTLKRIRYYTMNSWNLSTAPAYNLKVYNVINRDLQDKVFELMESEDFYYPINDLISDFNRLFDYRWQAGFNGRSGGYLVLYKGGCKRKRIFTDADFEENKNNYNGRAYADNYGWKSKAEAIKDGCYNREVQNVFSCPGQSIEENEAPADVLRAFRRLAVDIVKTTESMSRDCTIQEEKYTVEKTRKVII